ncbi:ABC transporter permease [Methanolobus sp. ZRKC3]|uniref:ABC transporter permease n=1 Tax=Methanolobus sp. ZRKC3 TaxID=3125786 RepID=UPI003246CC92
MQDLAIPGKIIPISELKDINAGVSDFDKLEFDFRENKTRKLLLAMLYAFASIALVFVFWHLVAQWGIHVRGVPFPTPEQTISRLVDMVQGESLYGKTIFEHLYASLMRWCAGFGIAVFCGIALGLFLGSSDLLHRTVMPAVYVVQLIPGLAWIPIALLIFGLGNTSTIFMIAATAFAPIVINTSGGIRTAPAVYARAARMMGAGKSTIFLRVLLPAAALSIINGLRIGLANGWRVLIAAEMVVGVGLGLGYSIIQARWSLDFEAAFVSIVVICIIGLLIEKMLFAVLEKKVAEQLT